MSTPGDSMFFTANVSNSATAHHYYYWFERNCWSDSGCQDEFQPIASGQDVSHISRTFGTLLAYKEVAVEVKDYPVTVYCTGASDTLKILGPAINDAFPGSPVGCGFSGQFYPFDQFKWTDSSGYVATGRRYRWDVCTNKKVFDPSTPES